MRAKCHGAAAFKDELTNETDEEVELAIKISKAESEPKAAVASPKEEVSVKTGAVVYKEENKGKAVSVGESLPANNAAGSENEALEPEKEKDRAKVI